MARNREIRLNYVGPFLGLPTSSATTFRITRTRHSPSLQQGKVQRQVFMQLRESTKRAIMTHPNHDQKLARLDTDASLLSAAANFTQQGRITAVWARALTPMRENCWLSWMPSRSGATDEVAPSYFRSHGQHDHATNIQPNQQNRRINGWIEVLYPLVWRHLPGGLLSNQIYISSIRSNLRSNQAPVTKNHVLGCKIGGLCL
jgi:hypothetical protein